jgi:hypothetical protein
MAEAAEMGRKGSEEESEGGSRMDFGIWGKVKRKTAQ